MIINYSKIFIIILYYINKMTTNPELSILLSLIIELRSLIKFHPLWKFIIGIRLNESILLKYKNDRYLFKIIEEDDSTIIYSIKIFINEIHNENCEEFYMSLSFMNNKIEISQYNINVDIFEENDRYISISSLLETSSHGQQRVELEYWN